MVVTREFLYKLVWSQPMTKIAAQLKVSDSYLARVCAALRVPRPERGYWAKMRVGKAGVAPPLPVPRPGDLLVWTKEVALPPVAPPKAKVESPIQRGGKKKVIEIHELIGGARNHFESGRPNEPGEYLRPFKKLLVDVTVSEAQIIRALATANELFNALEVAGHRVTLGNHGQGLSRSSIDENQAHQKTPSQRYPPLWTPSRPTLLYVGETPIGLALVELSEAVLVRYVNGHYIREVDYVPPKASRHVVDHSWTTTRDLRTGRLRLIAYAPQLRVSWSRHWQETKGETLLQQLPGIVAAMQQIASELAIKVGEADLEWERQRKQWQADEERRRRDEDRQMTHASVRASHEQLDAIILSWANAVSVEQFFRGVGQRAADLPEEDREVVLSRLALARDFLGSLDPLKFFLDWRTPLERHQPLYDHNGEPQENGMDG